MGFSFERSTLPTPAFEAGSADLIALFRLLGPGQLRLGGNSVDRTPWNPSGPGSTPGEVAPPDLTRLRAFADATGWQVLYGTPFVSATTTAETVADEVATVAQALGPRLDGIELCNEPDLYFGDPAHAAIAGTYPKFLARWSAFAGAIHTAAPHVALTGPAGCLLQTVDRYAQPFAEAESGLLQQLTQHYYRGFGGPQQTIDLLLSPDPLLASTLTRLGEIAEGAALPRGFRIGETNSFASGGQPGVSNTFASALWGANHFLQCTAAGAAGCNFHNSGTGLGYPAIVQHDGVVTEIRPLFAGLLLASQSGPGTHAAVTVPGAAPTLRAHAVSVSDTVVRVVLANHDPEHDLVVDVDLGRSIESATARRLEATGLTATTDVRYGDSSVPLDGSWAPGADERVVASGSTFSFALPRASAAVVEVTHAPAPHIEPPATTAHGRVTGDPSGPGGSAPAARPVSGLPNYTG